MNNFTIISIGVFTILISIGLIILSFHYAKKDRINEFNKGWESGYKYKEIEERCDLLMETEGSIASYYSKFYPIMSAYMYGQGAGEYINLEVLEKFAEQNKVEEIKNDL